MRSTVVFTLTGSDRVGIVEEVTGVLLGLGGNVETSRMARLGGEFAMLVLLSLSAEKFGELEGALEYLTDHGYKVTTTPTDSGTAAVVRRLVAVCGRGRRRRPRRHHPRHRGRALAAWYQHRVDGDAARRAHRSAG